MCITVNNCQTPSGGGPKGIEDAALSAEPTTRLVVVDGVVDWKASTIHEQAGLFIGSIQNATHLGGLLV